MLKYIAIVVSCAAIAGCSSSKLTNQGSLEERIKAAQKNPNIAMSHFIDGNIAEMRGDYAAAILEYQDVLSKDKSAGVYYALGKNYLLLNKLPQALSNAREASFLDKTNIDYQKLLADIYVSAYYSDSASAVYENIISLDSTDVDALYNLASLYEQLKPLRSLELYKKLVGLTGPEWNILVRMAEIYERLGKVEESVSTLEDLLAIDPSNTDLQKLLAEQYLKVSKFDLAMQNAEELIRIYPSDLSFRELKAQIFVARDDWKNAAKEYELILQSREISQETKMRIGSAYLKRSVEDSSLFDIAKRMFISLDKDTTSWQIKMVLGEISLQEKNDSSAQYYFKQAVDLAEWNPDAFIRLGGLYFDNAKYSDAVVLLENAINNFPDNFVINLILGLSNSQMNNFSGAEKYLKKALELNPKDITALSAYGFALNQLKKTDESISYINKALDIMPDNVDLLGTLGMIYNSQKKWELCDSVYNRAVQLDSSNALILNNFAYSLAERGIQLSRALKMVKEAVNSDSLNSSYLDTIGWVYFQMGDFGNAEKYIGKAIALDAENSTLMEHLGDVSFKLGNKAKAMEMWLKSYHMNKENLELKRKIDKGEL